MRKLEEHFRTDDHFGKNVSCKAQMQPGTLPPETNSGKKTSDFVENWSMSAKYCNFEVYP